MRRYTAGTVQLEEGKAQGYLINVYKYIYTWREKNQNPTKNLTNKLGLEI